MGAGLYGHPVVLRWDKWIYVIFQRRDNWPTWQIAVDTKGLWQ